MVEVFTKQLLSDMVAKIERLEGEKENILEDLKEVYSECKSRGFDTTILKKVINYRKKDRKKLLEDEEIFDLYLKTIEG